MSVKIIKVVQQVGSATEDGVTFTAGELMNQTHLAFHRAMRSVFQRGGVTTGPAKIKVVVEQEVVLND